MTMRPLQNLLQFSVLQLHGALTLQRARILSALEVLTAAGQRSAAVHLLHPEEGPWLQRQAPAGRCPVNPITKQSAVLTVSLTHHSRLSGMGQPVTVHCRSVLIEWALHTTHTESKDSCWAEGHII